MNAWVFMCARRLVGNFGSPQQSLSTLVFDIDSFIESGFTSSCGLTD